MLFRSVEKSAFEEIQKAAEADKVELLKAKEIIAQYETEKKEQIVKSKTQLVKSALQDDKFSEVIVKAALALDSEDDFNSFVQAVTQLRQEVEKQKDLVQKSALFQEIGATVDAEAEVKKESPVSRLVKAKYQK